MKEMLEKLKKLKKGRELPEAEKAGKLAALDELSSAAKEAMGKKVGTLKKVTVAAPSEEGLEAGLEKAKEIVEAKDAMEGPACEACEDEGCELCEAEEMADAEEMSEEEIEAEIQRLMALKSAKKKV